MLCSSTRYQIIQSEEHWQEGKQRPNENWPIQIQKNHTVRGGISGAGGVDTWESNLGLCSIRYAREALRSELNTFCDADFLGVDLDAGFALDVGFVLETGFALEGDLALTAVVDLGTGFLALPVTT